MQKSAKTLCTAIILLMVQLQVQAQTAPEITGSKVTQAQAQEALDLHNKVRANVNVPGLQWSVELATFAQQWADHLSAEDCQLQHRPDNGEWAQKYGENIFMGAGVVYTALNASESWYSEIKDFTPGILTGSNWYQTGHYTQMVWRNTTRVGIGIATCASGAIIIVGNYDPAGNYMGESPY